MGTKGDKRTGAAKESAAEMVERLAALGDVTSKGMFGGYGIFESGVMFGLVNAAGVVHFRVDDTTRTQFEEAGATAHGKMPYYAVPERLMDDAQQIQTWARGAIAVAHRAKASS